MTPINFKRTVTDSMDSAVLKLTEGLKKEGFGILTRIDLHDKFKEKLDKTIRPVVVLGACNPGMAYEVFLKSTDFACLLPCNAVIRDLGDGQLSIELAKPTVMMAALGDQDMVKMAAAADLSFQRVLEGL